MNLLLRGDGLNESVIRAIKEVYRPGGGYPYPADLGNYSIWWADCTQQPPACCHGACARHCWATILENSRTLTDFWIDTQLS